MAEFHQTFQFPIPVSATLSVESDVKVKLFPIQIDSDYRWKIDRNSDIAAGLSGYFSSVNYDVSQVSKSGALRQVGLYSTYYMQVSKQTSLFLGLYLYPYAEMDAAFSTRAQVNGRTIISSAISTFKQGLGTGLLLGSGKDFKTSGMKGQYTGAIAYNSTSFKQKLDHYVTTGRLPKKQTSTVDYSLQVISLNLILTVSL